MAPCRFLKELIPYLGEARSAPDNKKTGLTLECCRVVTPFCDIYSWLASALAAAAAASKRDLGYAGHSTVVAVVSYRDPHLDSTYIFC